MATSDSEPMAGIERAGTRLAGPHEALSVAIASGKGGTGKSFLATNLGIVAARRGCRCTLVDADYGLAADHLLLGVTPRRTLQDLVEGRAVAASLPTSTPYGLTLVPGATGVQELASLGRNELVHVARGFGDWSRAADLLLIDTGAGIQASVIATIAAADVVLLVVHSEIASLTDAYAVVKCLTRRPGVRPIFGVVVNRVTARGVAAASYRRLADVAQKFLGVPLHDLGAVSEEPAVTPRRLGQPPLVVTHPECRTAQEIRSILARLELVAGGIGPRPGSGAEASITTRMMSQLPKPR